MSFFSFLRLFGVRRLRNSRPARARKPRRRTQAPSVEALESRLTPATPPTILSVTPQDGAVLTGANSTPPAIQVLFSEPMNRTDVQNPANYLLVNSAGAAVSVQSVTVSTSANANDTAVLS